MILLGFSSFLKCRATQLPCWRYHHVDTKHPSWQGDSDSRIDTTCVAQTCNTIIYNQTRTTVSVGFSWFFIVFATAGPLGDILRLVWSEDDSTNCKRAYSPHVFIHVLGLGWSKRKSRALLRHTVGDSPITKKHSTSRFFCSCETSMSPEECSQGFRKLLLDYW